VKIPEAGGRTYRHNVLAQTRIIVRGPGFGLESTDVNSTGLPEDFHYFQRPGMLKLRLSNLLGPGWSDREK
jgi:hypothetical protein